MSKARPPLDRLERTIAARAAKPNKKSYTSQLLSGGLARMGAKVMEEAAEVVEAAGELGAAGREHFIREVGDLFYHLLVLMRHRECSLADVEAELAQRFGVSGLQEKASRKTAEAVTPVAVARNRVKKAKVKAGKPKKAKSKARRATVKGK